MLQLVENPHPSLGSMFDFVLLHRGTIPEATVRHKCGSTATAPSFVLRCRRPVLRVKALFYWDMLTLQSLGYMLG